MAALAGVVTVGVAQSLYADELVTDGEFEDFTTISGAQYAGSTSGGQLQYNIEETPTTGNVWTGNSTALLGLIMTTAAANSTGVGDQFGESGDNFNFSDTSKQPVPTVPGNIFADDADSYQETISELITGLHSGQQYTVSFLYGADTQTGNTGGSAYWEVSLGGTTKDTTTINVTSAGFEGASSSAWDTANFTFTANGTSDTLTFLSQGSGAPSFALLADVSIVAPEPSTVFAGVFLLLPVGVRVVRMLRKKTPAQA
jgi:hypothetical protein